MHTRSEVSFGADRRATGEITTPQALVYSSYMFAENSDRRRRQSKYVQLRGIMGYARHEYETDRPVDVGVLSTEARGTHDAQELSAQGEVEFVDNIGEFRLQTLFGLRYIRQQSRRLYGPAV
jgi:hypothetical protein